jgi:serpin B
MKPFMLLGLLGACAPNDFLPCGGPHGDDGGYQDFIDANTGFALDLYSHVRGGDGNLVFSPYSISQALAMTDAGAAGRTLVQMQLALDTKPGDSTLHAEMRRLQADLASRRLHASNLLRVEPGKQLSSPFLDQLAAYYGAGVYAQGAGAADRTSDMPVDRIPVAAETASSGTSFVLANAAQLEAAWAQPFDPRATSPGDFTLDSGQIVEVPMMVGSTSLAYFSEANLEAVELPYAGDLSLVVIQSATKQPGAFATLEAELAAGALIGVIEYLAPARRGIAMPKVALASQLNLRDALASMGMTDAFDPAVADFSAMAGTHDVVLDNVVHHSSIAIDESGTGSAPADAIAVSDPPPSEEMMIVDRPYVFAIRDRATGAILFMGRVLDPTQ